MKALLIVLIIFNCYSGEMHPMHVSVTEIDYDEKEHELEIMMRIFVDDLERAIQNENEKPELDIVNASESDKRTIIKTYLEKHFSLSLDHKLQTTKYLGQEIEGEAMICYIQVPGVKKWKTIEVTNSSLMHLYDDQSNLVHVTLGEKVKSMRLTSDNQKGKFTFE
jgi:hypothetical protein